MLGMTYGGQEGQGPDTSMASFASFKMVTNYFLKNSSLNTKNQGGPVPPSQLKMDSTFKNPAARLRTHSPMCRGSLNQGFVYN
jgi:hypothetical protein